MSAQESAWLSCCTYTSSMVEVPRCRVAIIEEHLILIRPHHQLKLIAIHNKFSSQGLQRDGSGNLHWVDEWSFCLTAARMAAEQERR